MHVRYGIGDSVLLCTVAAAAIGAATVATPIATALPHATYVTSSPPVTPRVSAQSAITS